MGVTAPVKFAQIASRGRKLVKIGRFRIGASVLQPPNREFSLGVKRHFPSIDSMDTCIFVQF